MPKVAGISCVCHLIVMVDVGWFIISLYNWDSEEWCFSLARMRVNGSPAGLSFFCVAE